MTNSITRRTLMTAVPAVALCGAAPAAQPDPFLFHYRQWIEARAEWRRLIEMPEHDDWETPETKAQETIEYEAFERMAETIPTSQEGFAALSTVIWEWHGPTERREIPEYQEQVNRSENRILLNLYRALSGEKAVPVI
jgi:MoxR-like ATPase